MARIVLLTLAAAALAGCASAQYKQPSTTPVPILKQINRHNEDGSYSYGYEGADGSFKIETKFPNGEVAGKYGYVDENGKAIEIEYGASKRGFEVAGPGINVPPPTLVNNDLGSNDYDDGQYREDPSIYLKETASGSKAGPASQLPLPPAARPAPRPAPIRQQFTSPAYTPRAPSHVQQYFPQQPAYNPAPAYNPEPAYNPAPAYNPVAYYNPAPAYNPGAYYNPAAYQVDPNQFSGHPARNIDIRTGSYSVQYNG